jgi:tetratricopeptide (TPR) repeat protein
MEKDRLVQEFGTIGNRSERATEGRLSTIRRLLLCTALLAPVSACMSPASEEDIRNAELAVEAENWSRAAELWYEIHQGEPSKSERSYIETARALFESGQVESSCALLREAELHYPESAKVLALHGRILEHMRFSRAAEGVYANWASLEPRSAAAQLALGRVRLDLGWEHGALKPLEMASELDPTSVQAQVHLATLWATSGQPEMAFPHFVRATELGADDPRFLTTASEIALAEEVAGSEQGAVELGFQWADRVTTLQPQNTLAHYLRGVHLQTLGRRSEAIGALMRAVETDPGCLPSLIRLISLYREAGEGGRAQQMLDRALMAESDPDARERLCALLSEEVAAADLAPK